MQLTTDAIRSLARCNPGTKWATHAQGKPFLVEVNPAQVVFLVSTGKRRPMSNADIDRFCDSYNASKSLKPGDYVGVTHNASYLLTMVRGVLSSSGDRPLIASDLDAPSPERALAWTFRVVRDTQLAKRVKSLHDDVCQICGGTIELGNDDRYSEAHHVRPLGGGNDGRDVLGNLLCVCPNCHARCDLGAIPLELSTLRSVDGHRVDPMNIDYHNQLHGFPKR